MIGDKKSEQIDEFWAELKEMVWELIRLRSTCVGIMTNRPSLFSNSNY